jgi:hypothetical protein
MDRVGFEPTTSVLYCLCRMAADGREVIYSIYCTKPRKALDVIMKVRVYFSKEPDTVEIILRTQKISRQALDTIYELVWEGEFKNILNAGRVWLKFKENEERPFGIPLREKRTHTNISPGDIIQITDDFFVVNKVGARKIEVID